jgi:DNA-directed RNA polymerase specialized sigma24 family protein
MNGTEPAAMWVPDAGMLARLENHANSLLRPEMCRFMEPADLVQDAWLRVSRLPVGSEADQEARMKRAMRREVVEYWWHWCPGRVTLEPTSSPDNPAGLWNTAIDFDGAVEKARARFPQWGHILQLVLVEELTPGEIARKLQMSGGQARRTVRKIRNYAASCCDKYCEARLGYPMIAPRQELTLRGPGGSAAQ